MGLSEDIRKQLIESFKTEQGEHVQKINEGLLALEKDPEGKEQQALLNDIFREAHSLKGAARATGMTTIESLGHALEGLLLNAKEGRRAFSPDLFDLLYQSLDAIEQVMVQLESGDSTPPAQVLTVLAQLEEANKQRSDTPPDAPTSPDTPTEAATEEQAPENSETPSPLPLPQSDETIRVSINKLDALMAQFSELLGAKIRAEQRLAEVRQMQTFASDWQKEWLALRSHYSRLVRGGNGSQSKDIAHLVDFATRNQDQLRTLDTQSNTLYRQLSNDTMRLSLIINELQEEIKRVRMLPLSTITATFGRMIRDLAREQDKQITLTIVGGETELDKRVLEQIKDPLIHLLRNAADHGLETIAEREQAGKPAEGQITLSAAQQGNNVVISVSDDGAGLDLAAIRLSAVGKNLMSMAEAEKLSQTDTANLIFKSGLSTSQIITDISGRGVGLDVVRKNVEELHGTLEVNSELGQGTAIALTLPLTLASSHGLLIQVGDEIFALPHSTVESMLHVKQSDIANVKGKEAIIYLGKPVALAWLEDLLHLPPSPRNTEQITVVIVAVAEKRLGLVVDSLAGEQEIVMKSLGKQLAKVGGIAGATVLGSGRVVLVLHTADLVKLAARTQSRTPVINGTNHKKEADQRKTILVVDDSITTRTLEKNILEAAGYEVKIATDGEEALGVLASDGLPDLIVSDINMPRLDGIELTNQVKTDDRYSDIPLILVTSLDSPADKARGVEVGADAYIVKGRFDQGNLLAVIEQLL